MRKGAFRQLRVLAAHLDDLVVFRALARDDEVAGHVREQDEAGVEFLLVFISLGEQGGGFRLHGGDFRLRGFRLGLLPFLHQGADLRGGLLLLGQEPVGLGLEGLPVVVERDDLLHDRAGVEILDGEFRYDMLGILAEGFECKHSCNQLKKRPCSLLKGKSSSFHPGRLSSGISSRRVRPTRKICRFSCG